MVKSLNLKLWRDLKTLRTQSLTVAILVAVGVSLLVSSWSAYRSLQKSRDQYYQDYNLSDIFASVKRAPLYVLPQIQKIQGVRAAESRLVYEGLVDLENQPEPAVGHFISLPNDGKPLMNKLHLRTGRLPEVSSQLEVVVHESFARTQRLKPGNILNVVIQGKKKKLLIVGVGLSPEYVYALSAAAPLPDNKHFGIFWTTRQTLEQFSGTSSSFNDVVLTLYPEANRANVILELDRLLKAFGSFGAYGRDRHASTVFVDDEIKQQKVTSVFSPFVFLSIAAFLIHVISARLISLQRVQIATLKAIGYNNFEISVHYLKLVLSMTLLGVFPGIALGAWLGGVYAEMYKDYFQFPNLNFTLNFESAFVGILVGIIPGIVGAFTAIRDAFQLAPAEAMRPPAPPAFHRSFFDALNWTHRLSIRSKMLWRNLFFRPWRTVLTILGLSASLSVVILSGFWSGTIDTLLNVQFQKIQKEDISLSLIKPESVRLLQQLQKIPGVIQIEAYRATPIRIRFLHHKKELALTGYPVQPELYQALNRDLKPIAIPEGGLYLSRYFQDQWQMKIGDTVEIEFLEGKMKVLQLKVAGFTDDFIGQKATISIHELWRLLAEPPSYNLINLKSDSKQQQELYMKFKSSPNISSVNFKTVMYRSFQESFGDMMKTSTNILILFALAIAISIIYNSVRVSFSERSWQMASLRVLGFEKLDVFLMLLAEITVQLVLSLVPGCLLGWYLSGLSIKMMNTEYFSFPLNIPAETYAQAILVQYFSLIISLIIIWLLLKKLNMVEALKARD